jgi:hypothetical protein
MRSLGLAVLGFCCLAALCVGVARATGGGSSIAAALVVTPGVQEAGSTSSNADGCQNGFQFWTLHLTQGDVVKVTWGGTGAVDRLALWPTGTSDADNNGCLYDPVYGWSHWTPSPVLQDANPAPATQRLSQTFVTKTGSYPLLFLDTTGVQNAGSYFFTAQVLHAASVSLPHISSIRGAGQLTAGVLAPDSSPISDSALTLTLNGYWSSGSGAPATAHKLATATPTNGSATFSYSLPIRLWGKKIQLAITGSGSNYQPVASQTGSVKVLVPHQVGLGPIVVSSADLKAASKLLRKPIYWAGRRKGLHYELTRTASGNAFVRYLPHGVVAGDTRPKFLIVATYPFRGAYAAVKKYSKGKAVAGPHGSIYYVRPADRRSVLVAFPKVNYEIEVYDPSPAVARAIAASGRVRPVRGPRLRSQFLAGVEPFLERSPQELAGEIAPLASARLGLRYRLDADDLARAVAVAVRVRRLLTDRAVVDPPRPQAEEREEPGEHRP